MMTSTFLMMKMFIWHKKDKVLQAVLLAFINRMLPIEKKIVLSENKPEVSLAAKHIFSRDCSALFL